MRATDSITPTTSQVVGNPARLWQLISPTLPVGAYHYSQGLEQAVSCEWVRDEASAQDWVVSLLRYSVARIDLPILKRVHSAWETGDAAGVVNWDRICRACRETTELREEDANMGMALLRLRTSLGFRALDFPLGFTAAFAVLAADWRIEKGSALAGYAWSWCENQVAAAVKLVPLGHSAGQRILHKLGEDIGSAVAQGQSCEDSEIGGMAFGHALACAWHETKEVRLFRS